MVVFVGFDYVCVYMFFMFIFGVFLVFVCVFLGFGVCLGCLIQYETNQHSSQLDPTEGDCVFLKLRCQLVVADRSHLKLPFAMKFLGIWTLCWCTATEAGVYLSFLQRSKAEHG